MPTKLRQLRIKRLDLVDAGANQDAHVLLYKRAAPIEGADNPAEKGMLNHLLAVIGKKLGWQPEDVASLTKEMQEAETFSDALIDRRLQEAMSDLYDFTYALQDSIRSILHSDEADKASLIREALNDFAATASAMVNGWLSDTSSVTKIGRKISAQRLARLKAVLKDLSTMIAEAEGESMDKDKVVDKSQWPKEAVGEIEGLTKRISDLEAELAKTKVEKKDEPEDIWKGVSPALRQKFEAQEAELAVAKGIATREREERLTREYIFKAKSFERLPVNPDDDAKILREIDEKLSPEAATRVNALLKASDEALRQSKAFVEIGASGASSGKSAWGKIQALAKERITKGAKETEAQAIDAILKEHPELEIAYYEERSRPGN